MHNFSPLIINVESALSTPYATSGQALFEELLEKCTKKMLNFGMRSTHPAWPPQKQRVSLRFLFRYISEEFSLCFPYSAWKYLQKRSLSWYVEVLVALVEW